MLLLTLSIEDLEALDGIRKTFAAITFVFCLLAAGYIILFQKFRFPATRLVLYLTLTIMFDMVCSSLLFFPSVPLLFPFWLTLDIGYVPKIGYFFDTASSRPDPESNSTTDEDYKDVDGLCVVQAWWISLGDWAVALWILVIAVNVYLQVVKEILDTTYLEKWYHASVWTIALFFSLLPLIFGAYGHVSGGDGVRVLQPLTCVICRRLVRGAGSPKAKTDGVLGFGTSGCGYYLQPLWSSTRSLFVGCSLRYVLQNSKSNLLT
jgi:Slime mold cyclic AMP receptor